MEHGVGLHEKEMIMAKKKTGSSQAPRKSSSSTPPPLPSSMDRRGFEKTLADLARLMSEQNFQSIDEANAFLQQYMSGGGIPPQRPRTPLEEAQDIMYDAWQATGRRRVDLARKALAVSPDCADAYVLLAEETARSLVEARTLYEEGVKAGERALGQARFEEDAGHFWGITDTRPYMRARKGLADTLWALGQHHEAMAHYQELLRLNPGDNQGIRYVLAQCLLAEGEDTALDKLLDQYKDDASADWAYTRALSRFRREGGSRRANTAAKAALRANAYVPLYLAGIKKLPRRLPDYVGLGDENEAVSYAAASISIWRKTEGAIEWLLANMPQ